MGRTPIRVTFGPLGRDRVQVILPDGRDIAPDLRMTAICASVTATGETEVTLRIMGAKVEALTFKVEQNCIGKPDEVPE